MADTINKPSIQIRSGLPSPLSDKSPSPATKLLISHGKPNFTIARSPKLEDNDGHHPLSPQPNANNNYNPYKCAGYNNNSSNSNKFVVGTKFNGVFKPSTAAASWANSNGNANGSADQNEAAKVVLRRPKLADVESTPAPADDDENLPEFIRRQRRIQERLAKENVLDFENRRSGYFTHVMISPDSPNRTSFVETMASPAIVPSLEMPLPAKIEEEKQLEQRELQQEQAVPTANGHSAEPAVLTNGHNGGVEEEKDKVEVKGQEQEQPLSNGHAHDDVAPEEVAKAIEEVNKAVAGEDDDGKAESEQVEAAAAAIVEPTVVEVAPSAVEVQVEVVTPAAHAENGVAHEEASITISHTNGHASEQPTIATPDPSGALGVNYEPKTVVSFAQELGSGENNYPDTVQVTKEVPASAADAELQELTKLTIQNDEKNEVQVTPVLRAE
ncbi:uncharacterized protein LOC111592206 [Drosophila hydei]|uniref:Uncharacterized protein LOC111592206 n=1 Tax=Drosophila hydei TaxID=7224 RepID=A0A6J1LA27_DROHY|nr:uncharacterized protein LOC111592206 [Drosophila hydei]XP_023160042.2 uncharacterized protein LOC111592206 [Drosophila hydei]XP_023160043.2 uncharacterized protein LOC111592206 [Drosophila hydei]XP_023160044.2 uncharacterized protein LOC111592206 [Drosophila hydei]